MTHPEYVYYAVLWLLAFPAAAFSRTAGVIVVSWLAAHIVVLLGVHFEAVNLVQHAIAFALCAMVVRRTVGMIATFLFVPMIVVDGMVMMGGIPALDGWWAIWGLAITQAAILPLGVKRGRWVEFGRRIVGAGGRSFDLFVAAIGRIRAA